MWLVIALPPFANEFSHVASRCIRCGADRQLRIHEYPKQVTRFGLAYEPFAVLGEKGDGFPIKAYKRTVHTNVRYRCLACGQTFTPLAPDRGRRSRLGSTTEAYLTTMYCLGYSPQSLTEPGIIDERKISRATLYRVLNTAGDDRLKVLHRHNRMVRRRTKNFGSLSRLAWVWSDPVEVDYSDDPTTSSTFSEVNRWVQDDHWVYDNVVLHKMEWLIGLTWVPRTEMLQETIDWLGGYLRGVGHAGILSFEDRDQLERASPLPATAPDRLAISSAHLAEPVRSDQPWMARAIRVLLNTDLYKNATFGEGDLPRVEATLAHGRPQDRERPSPLRPRAQSSDGRQAALGG